METNKLINSALNIGLETAANYADFYANSMCENVSSAEDAKHLFQQLATKLRDLRKKEKEE